MLKMKISSDIIFRIPFFHFKIPAFSSLAISFFIFAAGVFAQNSSDEIRGYKVHKAKIKIQNQADAAKTKDADATINLGEPVAGNISLFGVSYEIAVEFSALKQSGEIDFFVFRDFRANDVSIEIADYRESLKFSKNQIVKFPKPVKVYLNLRQAMSGALGELRDSKEFWRVTGTVLVFGRFKKFGFKFKRVVPVEINLQIKNPLNI